MSKIEAVILYCSIDERFFKTCISNLLTAGVKCNVITYSHLFAGEKENIPFLDKSISLFQSSLNFKHTRIDWREGETALYWEAFGRYVGISMTGKDCDNVLFIDSDEIVEPIPFKRWLQFGFQDSFKAVKLPQHTYAITPQHQLKVKAYNTIICKKDYVMSLPFKVDARLQYFNNKNVLSRWLAKLGFNPHFFIYKGKPFIHHYTGVRTKEQMIKKVTNWSHNSDRIDWVEHVQKTFGKIINQKVGRHKFKIVPNKFNL